MIMIITVCQMFYSRGKVFDPSHWEIFVSCTIQTCNNVTTLYYRICAVLQLFRVRSSYEREKLTRQCRKLSWVIVVYSIKKSQTRTTSNINRHCRVRFNTFVGNPLSKQLSVKWSLTGGEKETFLKVIVVSYERWSLTMESKYRDLTWKLLVF